MTGQIEFYAMVVTFLREQKRRKAHYQRCRESYLIRGRKRYAENRELCLAQQREYGRKNQELISQRRKVYAANRQPAAWENRRANRRKYFANQYPNNLQFRLVHLLRSRMDSAMRGNTQSKKTLELLGCSIRQLRAHLGWQFKPGMTWDNAGEWHIDHIRPCASFDLTNPDQQKSCFNYTNLQPLWSKDNLSKGTKYKIERE